jgi:hypothetical protein
MAATSLPMSDARIAVLAGILLVGLLPGHHDFRAGLDHPQLGIPQLQVLVHVANQDQQAAAGKRAIGGHGRAPSFRFIQNRGLNPDLQFAFPILQFAIATAIDCKLQSTNCKVQIDRLAAAGPRRTRHAIPLLYRATRPRDRRSSSFAPSRAAIDCLSCLPNPVSHQRLPPAPGSRSALASGECLACSSKRPRRRPTLTP